MSARASWRAARRSETTLPPKRSASERARSARRLATKNVATPCSRSACARQLARLAGADDHDVARPAGRRASSRASATATEETLARPAPIAVSVRTRLPVCSAAREEAVRQRAGGAGRERSS